MIYKSYIAAYQAAAEKRKKLNTSDMIIKVETSPFGGFTVKMIPVELFVEPLSEPYKANPNFPSACQHG